MTMAAAWRMVQMGTSAETPVRRVSLWSQCAEGKPWTQIGCPEHKRICTRERERERERKRKRVTMIWRMI